MSTLYVTVGDSLISRNFRIDYFILKILICPVYTAINEIGPECGEFERQPAVQPTWSFVHVLDMTYETKNNNNKKKKRNRYIRVVKSFFYFYFYGLGGRNGRIVFIGPGSSRNNVTIIARGRDFPRTLRAVSTEQRPRQLSVCRAIW